METLAKRVRFLRAAASVSARELARLACLDSSHIRRIESGDRPDPATSTTTAIAAVFDVSLDWLARGLGEVPSDAKIRTAIERARFKHNAAVAAVA